MGGSGVKTKGWWDGGGEGEGLMFPSPAYLEYQLSY